MLQKVCVAVPVGALGGLQYAKTRATLFLPMPAYERKSPAMITFPSVCKAEAYIQEFAPVPGLKLRSKEPLVLRRARRLMLLPLKVVNCPPMIIFPSGCRRILWMVEFAPVPILKEASWVPF